LALCLELCEERQLFMRLQPLLRPPVLQPLLRPPVLQVLVPVDRAMVKVMEMGRRRRGRKQRAWPQR